MLCRCWKKKSINERTPIHNASQNDHHEVVKYLHEQCHDDVETKDKDGCTPIYNASQVIIEEFDNEEFRWPRL